MFWELLKDTCQTVLGLILFKLAVLGGCIYGFVLFIMSLTSCKSISDFLCGLLLWIGATLFIAIAAFVILFIVVGVGAILLGLIGGLLGAFL